MLRKYMADELGIDVADVSVTIPGAGESFPVGSAPPPAAPSSHFRLRRQLATSLQLLFSIAPQSDDAETQKVVDSLANWHSAAIASIVLHAPVVETPSVSIRLVQNLVVRPPLSPPAPPVLTSPSPPVPPPSSNSVCVDARGFSWCQARLHRCSKLGMKYFKCASSCGGCDAPNGSCTNVLSTARCERKQRKNKCHKSRFRERLCVRTCGACDASASSGRLG